MQMIISNTGVAIRGFETWMQKFEAKMLRLSELLF